MNLFSLQILKAQCFSLKMLYFSVTIAVYMKESNYNSVENLSKSLFLTGVGYVSKEHTFI